MQISPSNGWYVTRQNRGDPFQFHCEGAEGDIVWKHNGVILTNEENCFVNTSDRQICSDSVYVFKFRNEFVGVYTCEDSETGMSKNVTLGGNKSSNYIKGDCHCDISSVFPEFDSPEEISYIIRRTGQELKLSCKVQQHVYPEASVTWSRRNGQNVLQFHKGETIVKIAPDVKDSGVYSCEARNHVNEATESKTFYVIVYGETDIPFSVWHLLFCCRTSKLHCTSAESYCAVR